MSRRHDCCPSPRGCSTLPPRAYIHAPCALRLRAAAQLFRCYTCQSIVVAARRIAETEARMLHIRHTHIPRGEYAVQLRCLA